MVRRFHVFHIKHCTLIHRHECIADYLNTDDVRSALHVNGDRRPTQAKWMECNYTIYDMWPSDDIYGSVYNAYEKLLKMNSDLKVLIYSGDNDLICPTVGTQYWLFNKLHLQVRLTLLGHWYICLWEFYISCIGEITVASLGEEWTNFRICNKAGKRLLLCDDPQRRTYDPQIPTRPVL